MPRTASNVIDLDELGFYNGIRFHRSRYVRLPAGAQMNIFRSRGMESAPASGSWALGSAIPDRLVYLVTARRPDANIPSIWGDYWFAGFDDTRLAWAQACHVYTYIYLCPGEMLLKPMSSCTSGLSDVNG